MTHLTLVWPKNATYRPATLETAGPAANAPEPPMDRQQRLDSALRAYLAQIEAGWSTSTLIAMLAGASPGERAVVIAELER